MKDKNKVFYNRKNVDFHSFIDFVSVFEPEHLTDNYYQYRKILKEEYQTNEDILNIVELVRNIEVDDGDILVDSVNSISVVIYLDGNIKYVACYWN